jgi:hypothetical protein
MSDMMGQGPNYFAAVADLARDVGGVSAQINERVTYKELMAQNTQQRHEITNRIDKVEEHLSETVRQSVSAIETRMEGLTQRLEALATAVANSNPVPGGGGSRVFMGSVATTVGAAVAVAAYLLLRAFGVHIP